VFCRSGTTTWHRCMRRSSGAAVLPRVRRRMFRHRPQEIRRRLHLRRRPDLRGSAGAPPQYFRARAGADPPQAGGSPITLPNAAEGAADAGRAGARRRAQAAHCRRRPAPAGGTAGEEQAGERRPGECLLRRSCVAAPSTTSAARLAAARRRGPSRSAHRRACHPGTGRPPRCLSRSSCVSEGHSAGATA